MAIYAAGHDMFANQFANHDPQVRPHLIQLQTYMHFEKQLRNLQIQEMRLRRNREKDTAQFNRLKQERLQSKQTKPAAKPVTPPKPANQPDDEFEFSLEEVDAELDGLAAFINAQNAALDSRDKLKNIPDAA